MCFGGGGGGDINPEGFVSRGQALKDAGIITNTNDIDEKGVAAELARRKKARSSKATFNPTSNIRTPLPVARR